MSVELISVLIAVLAMGATWPGEAVAGDRNPRRQMEP